MYNGVSYIYVVDANPLVTLVQTPNEFTDEQALCYIRAYNGTLWAERVAKSNNHREKMEMSTSLNKGYMLK